MDFQLTPQQRDFVSATRQFARARLADDTGGFGREGGLNRKLLADLAAQGLAGLAIAEADGGQGATLLDAVLAIEAVAGVDPIAGDAVQALNFGAIQQLAAHGSPALKERYLRPCLRGEKLVSISMTEPEAGSAVTEMTSSARIAGDEVVVSGQKIFSTNGDVADCFVVWAKFGPGKGDAGAVVVDRDAPGLVVDSSHTFMSGEHYGVLYLDDVRVPRENILLEADGFRRMFAVFNIERLGNSARSLALGTAAFDRAVEHARNRQQFGSRLADFQGLQWRFAEIAIALESARLMLYQAACNVSAGLPAPSQTAMAKLACNRAGFAAADHAVQVFGGHGYDSEADVGYLFRRTRGWMIAGGTIEQMLNRVAKGIFAPTASTASTASTAPTTPAASTASARA